MQQKWIYTLAVALLLTLSSGDITAAPKSRASKKSAKAKASSKNKKVESKKVGKVKKQLREKVSAKVSRNRASKRERAKAVISRRGRRGRVRDRYISRKAARRQESKTQASRATTDEAQEPIAPPAPRLVASGIPADRVIEIQNALIRAGHYEGPASGQYDEATANAMKQFQTANGLRVTGLPTAHTLKKLGVSKRSGDGYAVPVKSVTEQEKRP